VLVAGCAVALGACQGTTDGSAGAPEAPGVRAAAPPPPGTEPWQVVAGESDLAVYVYRAGSLARLGHNHVVATGEISGRLLIAPTPTESTLEITIEKSRLLVDEPARRHAAGEEFAAEIPPDAVAATRENMLGPRLLDAVNHPRISIRSVAITGDFPDLQITSRVKVLDRWFELTFPVRVEISGDRLRAVGERQVTHGELGLEPYSVMLGALSVQDDMKLKYSIVAER
jgi:hypothetical protein